MLEVQKIGFDGIPMSVLNSFSLSLSLWGSSASCMTWRASSCVPPRGYTQLLGQERSCVRQRRESTPSLVAMECSKRLRWSSERQSSCTPRLALHPGKKKGSGQRVSFLRGPSGRLWGATAVLTSGVAVFRSESSQGHEMGTVKKRCNRKHPGI